MVTSHNLAVVREHGHGYIVGRNRRRSGEVFDYIQSATGPWIECPVGITAREKATPPNPHHSHADRCRPPFFGAFHALAIDDGGGGTGLSFRLLAAGDVERVVNAIQHTIAVPPDEVVVDRAVRRKVLRKGSAIGNRCSKYT